MLRRHVRIDHRHSQVAVAKNPLKGQDVAAVHHEVASKGMAQNVAQLPLGEDYLCPRNGLTEGGVGRAENAVAVSMLLVVGCDPLCQVARNRNRPHFARLRFRELNALMLKLCDSQSLSVAVFCASVNLDMSLPPPPSIDTSLCFIDLVAQKTVANFSRAKIVPMNRKSLQVAICLYFLRQLAVDPTEAQESRPARLLKLCRS